MTREEALKFFRIDDEEELEDLYEEQLFEQKQFFLSKAPISKLFESRISKLLKTGEAYASLSGKETSAIPEIPVHEIVPGEILGAYLSFQKAKNNIRRLISNETNAENLASLAKSLVELEKKNAALWYSETEDEDVIISKEPDPMYLLEAIKIYLQQGGETFVQLKNLENNPPEILVQEMKRLSLLFKKY